MPESATSFAVSHGKKYMSVKLVVPHASISSSASAVPIRISSPVSRASTGNTLSNSHFCSGRSVPTPRSSVMAAWVWAFTNPGSSSFPDISFSRSKSPSGRAAPTAAIIVPSTATKPSRITPCGV